MSDYGNYRSHWIDKLAEEARLLGESRMIRDEQPLTDELTAAVVARFGEYLKRADKTAAWAARSMGVGAATLSQILSGTYPADAEKHVRSIDKWIEQQILREGAPKPAGFVRTRVVEEIYTMAKWVQGIGTIGCVHGPAGIGKTMTLKALRSEITGSVYMRITTAGQTKLAVMEDLARALRLGELKLTCKQLYNQLVDTLKGSNRLILVDEVHKLEGRQNDEALHALRDLHDDTETAETPGVPMLWAGMSNIAQYIQTGAARGYESLDQLNSRIKYWVNLTDAVEGADGGKGLYTIQDIRKYIAAQKVRVTPDAERWLQMLANTPRLGALRAVDGLLRLAVKVGGDKLIDAGLLRELREDQLGRRVAEQYEREMETWAAKAG